MNSTLMTAALAVAVGAAIYFIYQEIQRQKQQMEAMSRHMRKLEAMVWTYNIRPRGAQSQNNHSEAGSEFTDTEDERSSEEGSYTSDEENDVAVASPAPVKTRQPTPPTRETMQAHAQAHHAQQQQRMMQVRMQAQAQAHHQAHHQAQAQHQRYPAPQSFVRSQFQQHSMMMQRPPATTEPQLPEVVSFDSQRVTVVDQISEDEQQDEPSSSGNDGPAPVSAESAESVEHASVVSESVGEAEEGESVEENGSDEADGMIVTDVDDVEEIEREIKTDEEGPPGKIKVYADNARNRRMGRVGLAYGSVTTAT